MADEISRDVLLDSIKSCFTSSDYSDLVITCGRDTHKVHRMIVCSRAGFFARAIRFGGVETLNGKIDLPEDEPAMIRLLLQYLYEGEYEPRWPDIPKSLKELRDGSLIDTSLSHGEEMPYDYDFPHRCNIYNSYISCGREICPHHTCGTDCKVPGCRNFICKACKIPKGSAAQLLVHAKMYEYADKYDVAGLKELSSAKFEAACQVFWDEDFFVPAAHHALSTTMDEDRGLRDVVSATIAKHKELIAKPAVETLLTQFNGLSIDIFKQVAKKCSCGLEPK